jgi:hypothetical protein
MNATETVNRSSISNPRFFSRPATGRTAIVPQSK